MFQGIKLRMGYLRIMVYKCLDLESIEVWKANSHCPLSKIRFYKEVLERILEAREKTIVKGQKRWAEKNNEEESCR